MAKQTKDFKDIAKNFNSFDTEMLSSTSPIKESRLEATNQGELEEDLEENMKPFATRLPESLIIKLQQHQYWDRETITMAVANALNEYLAKFEGTNKPLPDTVLKMKKKVKKKKNS